jgi:hypothetical protein
VDIEQFLKDIELIEQQLIKRIEIALKRGYFSDVELSQISAELDFYQELNNLGYASKLEQYFENFDNLLLEINKQAQARGLAGITGVAARDLDTLIRVKGEELLGRANQYALQLRTKLFENIVAGTPVTELIKSLTEIPLRDYQLTVALNTGVAEFERAAIAKVYEESPEQRFILYGVLDDRTRPACQAVLEYQDKKGYTKKQIDDGELTKIVKEHAEEFTQNAKGETIPSLLKQALETDYTFQGCGGFNCRHRFRPL